MVARWVWDLLVAARMSQMRTAQMQAQLPLVGQGQLGEARRKRQTALELVLLLPQPQPLHPPQQWALLQGMTHPQHHQP